MKHFFLILLSTFLVISCSGPIPIGDEPKNTTDTTHTDSLPQKKYTWKEIQSKLKNKAFVFDFESMEYGGQTFFGFSLNDSVYRWYAYLDAQGNFESGGYMKGTYELDTIIYEPFVRYGSLMSDVCIISMHYYEKSYEAVDGGFRLTQDYEKKEIKWNDFIPIKISSLMEGDSMIIEGHHCKSMPDIYYNPFNPVIE